ncbi:hypothetical protein KV679_18900 [Bacillus sp. JRC01]|nr:hypothetical protein [Bacillus sp. JRC01]
MDKQRLNPVLLYVAGMVIGMTIGLLPYSRIWSYGSSWASSLASRPDVPFSPSLPRSSYNHETAVPAPPFYFICFNKHSNLLPQTELFCHPS